MDCKFDFKFLFTEDKTVIEKNEDKLQMGTDRVNQVWAQYNIKIFLRDMKVMAFRVNTEYL